MRGQFQFCSRYVDIQHVEFGLTVSNVKNWPVFSLGSLRVPKFMKACKMLTLLPLPSPKTHSFPLLHKKKISWRSSLKDDVLTQGTPSPQCSTLEVSHRVSQRVAFRVADLHWNTPSVTTVSTEGTTTLWVPIYEISGLVPKGHQQHLHPVPPEWLMFILLRNSSLNWIPRKAILACSFPFSSFFFFPLPGHTMGTPASGIQSAALVCLLRLRLKTE